MDVIDSLVVSVGLDPTNYQRGQQQVLRSNKQLRDDANTTAKELSAQGKQMAEFFSAAKTEVLGLIGALVGAGGITAFTKDATRALSDMGREARNINLTVSQLNAFQNVIERNGGSAQSATASLKGLVDQIQRARTFGDFSILRFLNPIGATIQDNPLTIWEKFVAYAHAHKNDPAMVNLIGHGLGFDQGLINATLQIGDVTEATRQLHEEMQRVATPEMVHNATELQKAWADLQHQATFTGESILNDYSPALMTVLNGTTELLKNKEAADVIKAIGLALGGLAAVRVIGGLAWLAGLGSIAKNLQAVNAALIAIDAWNRAKDPETYNPANWAPDSPFWQGMPPEQQKQYPNSPLNSAPTSWWQRNMPSWLGGGGGFHGGARPPIADQTLDPVQQMFLQALSAPESGGAYDVKNGGARFNDFSRFPEGVGPGGTSSAAGRYQFVSGTWHQQQMELGLPDFSPASQDKAAWYLASKTYRMKTGRDLESDLKAGGHEAQIAAAVGQHWGSLTADTLRGTRFSNADGPPAGPGGGHPPSVMPRVDPALVAKPGSNAPISTTNNDRSVSSQIGTINIQTQATDAHGIASDIGGAMDDLITQSDRLLQ